MRLTHALACAFLATTAFAQTPSPLPPNYQSILDTPDVLVQHVHYGPHESVPMHDHPSVSTAYIYLNDSGVVDITHEGATGTTVHRPPTHTGAIRISPGNFERHSVQNTSDLPSDFLRIELKHTPVSKELRLPLPIDYTSGGTSVIYDTPDLLIERLICTDAAPCELQAKSAPSLVVYVPLPPHFSPAPPPSMLDAGKSRTFTSLADCATEILRFTFRKP